MRESQSFRLAGESDVEAAANTIASAFADDPAWSRLLAKLGACDGEPSRDARKSWWRLFLETAVGYEWTWVTPGCEAVAVFIPPGCPEFGPAQERRADLMIATLPEPDQSYLRETIELFAAARPQPRHYYLSLLGTHRDHRGHGIGMTLLNHALTALDVGDHAAYLESSNPSNLDRYRSVGFADLGEFALPDNGPVITTMWRSAATDR